MIEPERRFPIARYDYLEPVDLVVSSVEPLFAELVATQAFRRLRDIKFLGGIDYRVRPLTERSSLKRPLH